jgi:hypothetical protein
MDFYGNMFNIFLYIKNKNIYIYINFLYHFLSYNKKIDANLKIHKLYLSIFLPLFFLIKSKVK